MPARHVCSVYRCISSSHGASIVHINAFNTALAVVVVNVVIWYRHGQRAIRKTNCEELCVEEPESIQGVAAGH